MTEEERTKYAEYLHELAVEIRRGDTDITQFTQKQDDGTHIVIMGLKSNVPIRQKL